MRIIAPPLESLLASTPNQLTPSVVPYLNLPATPSPTFNFPTDSGSTFLNSLQLAPSDTDDGGMANSILNILQPEKQLLSTIELNPSTPDWLRTIVWTDFRLAVLFFVLSPLALLIWSAVECRPKPPSSATTTPTPLAADAALRILVGYWQASSLLLITVLFNIGASPIGVVTGTVAQGMIYVSLNWWQSLNDEAASRNGTDDRGQAGGGSPLSRVFATWRTIASFTAGIGLAIQIPFLPCATTVALVDSPYCAAWLEPPYFAASLFDIGASSSQAVGDFAVAALAVYTAYLLYYVAVPLRDVGRDGRAVRSSFTLVDPLVMLGFLEDGEEN